MQTHFKDHWTSCIIWGGNNSAVLYLLNSGIPSTEKSNTQLQCRSNHGAHDPWWDVKFITIRGCAALTQKNKIYWLLQVIMHILTKKSFTLLSATELILTKQQIYINYVLVYLKFPYLCWHWWSARPSQKLHDDVAWPAGTAASVSPFPSPETHREKQYLFIL